jgi:AmiR/NasT family two-component response regulator
MVGERAPECNAPILDAAIARFDALHMPRAELDSVKTQLAERTLSPCLFLVPP